MFERLIHSIFEIFIALLTVAAYFVCFVMFGFWCWFTDKLVHTSNANWDEVWAILAKADSDGFATLMIVNPFVVALVCTTTIVLTIWCHALYVYRVSKTQKNTNEDLQ